MHSITQQTFLLLQLQGGLLFTCSADNTARSWSCDLAECCTVYRGHKSTITDLALKGQLCKLLSLVYLFVYTIVAAFHIPEVFCNLINDCFIHLVASGCYEYKWFVALLNSYLKFHTYLPEHAFCMGAATITRW